jgi:predicted MPP superfamily phosphohydrolase
MRRAIVRIAAFLAITGILTGIATAIWARFVAPFRLTVKQVVVQLPRRHAGLDGLTIAFVTDTHIGPHFPASALEPVARELEAAQPDIVLFGGDYISESPRFLKEAAPNLGRIGRTGRLGCWAILGNHDMANTRTRVIPAIEGAGITVLVNNAARIETGKGDLWVVGLDDGLLGKADLDAAYTGVPADAASICLWHEPDRVEESAPYGSFLQLSGHTHGGQVRLPVVGPLATPTLGENHVLGRFRAGDMELYVSAGIGMYRPPVRLGCPPELTIVRLVG